MEIRFRKIVDSDLEMVLRWRTSPNVTQWMFTDIPYDMENQKAWFDGLDYLFWIINVDGADIGTIYLKGNELGYYLGDDSYKPLVGQISGSFYWWAFNNGYEFFNIKIFCDHVRLICVHLLQGYRFVEVLKNYAKGQDVYSMKLSKIDLKGPRIMPKEIEI